MAKGPGGKSYGLRMDEFFKGETSLERETSYGKQISATPWKEKDALQPGK